MSAQLKIRGIDVALRDETGRFHCADKGLESQLNALLKKYPCGGEVANPAFYYGNKAIAEFGGEMLTYDETAHDEIDFED